MFKVAIKKQCSVLLFLGLMLIHTVVYGAVTITPAPGTDPKLIGNVQSVVDSFNGVMEQKYHVTLTNDVQIYICPDGPSYIDVLKTKFKLSKAEAEKKVHLTGGMARNGEKEKIVAINLNPEDTYDPEYHAYYTTAHELVHQVQFQLAGKKVDNKLCWMTEGTANVIGAQVVADMGYEPMINWKTNQVSIIRSAEKHVSPRLIGHIDYSLWESLMETRQYPYQVASIMVMYLQSKCSPNGDLDIIKYFRGGDDEKQDEVANFKQCFGISEATFTDDVEKCFKKTLITLGKLELKSKGNWDQGVGIDEGFYRSQVFFRQNFKAIIEARQEILFYPERFSYTRDLKKELKIKNQAEIEMVVKDNPWWIRSNQTWVNLYAIPQCPDQIFNMAVMMVTRLQKQQKSEAVFDEIVWLRQGVKYVLAAMITAEAEAGTVEGYRQRWLKAVEIKSMTLPLPELQTKDGWNRAVAQYGQETINSYAGLVVLQLIKEKGITSLVPWFDNPEKSTTGQELFEKTFEIDLGAYTVNFKI